MLTPTQAPLSGIRGFVAKATPTRAVATAIQAMPLHWLQAHDCCIAAAGLVLVLLLALLIQGTSCVMDLNSGCARACLIPVYSSGRSDDLRGAGSLFVSFESSLARTLST